MKTKDFFISYTEEDRPWAEWIGWQLEQAGYLVVLQAWDFGPGNDFVLAMQEAAAGSHRTLAVLSPRYLESGFAQPEWAAALARDPLGKERLLVPLRVEPCDPGGLLAQRIAIDLVGLTEAAAREVLVRGVSAVVRPEGRSGRPSAPPAFPGTPGAPGARPEFPGAPPDTWLAGASAIAGMASREAVFERDPPLPGQVFTVELLTQPLVLARDDRGKVCVTIQRDRVTHALYTTAAKRDLCDHVFADRESFDAALAVDHEIHAFLSGRLPREDLFVPLDRLPLRWSSGGVMSVVCWRSRYWVPFFFRDIEPCGWNISLGASELGDDLDDPWTFLMREFLEETLVLDREPRGGRPVRHRPFDFGRIDAKLEAGKAARFARQHIEARYGKDGLVVHPSDQSIPVHIAGTRTEILIERDGRGRLDHNVLVCINPLELGIEVVKVLRYDLDERDYLLDGEILSIGGSQELVRMPVGLISLDYLQRAFANLTDLRYVGRTQPSIEGPEFLPGEISLFAFDVERRRSIALGHDHRASAWERQQYQAWLERFGSYFFDGEGRFDPGLARPLFTPSSAKIVSYFLASRL